jgi:hypothetical protein
MCIFRYWSGRHLPYLFPNLKEIAAAYETDLKKTRRWTDVVSQLELQMSKSTQVTTSLGNANSESSLFRQDTRVVLAWADARKTGTVN